MKKKIYIRLIQLSLIAIIAVTAGITFIYLNYHKKQVINDLKVDADILRRTGYFDLADVGEEKLAEIKERFKDLPLRITWISKDGDVLLDTKVFPADNHMERPEIADAAKNGEGSDIRKSYTLNASTYYYAINLQNGTYLRTSVDAASAGSIIFSALPLVGLISAGVFLACIIIAKILTAEFIKPVNDLADSLNSSRNNGETPAETLKYKELVPIYEKISAGCESILDAAKARQDFTANVSHELKTPLTAISGYAELIANDMAGDRYKLMAEKIVKNSDRLVGMINDTIKLSELDYRKRDGDFKEVDLNLIAKEVCENMTAAAASLDVTINYVGQISCIFADIDLLKELLDNLIQNAVCYNKPGGRVDVTVDKVNEKVVLCVEDTGIGIPKDCLNHVFERFYRVDKSRSRRTGGTGLGLAIVKHIGEVLNADIKISSKINEGTRVSVIFN